MERKSFGFELKELDESGTFTGYGAVFGNTDLDREIIEPGAFSRTLAEHKARGTMPAMLAHHDMRNVIGLWQTMREDDRGLLVKGELITDVANARDVYTLMKKRALRGLSIGFRVKEFEFDSDGTRRIKDVDLFEVSVVSIPANSEALLTDVKSLIANLGQLSPDERAALRKALAGDEEPISLEEIKEMTAAEMERALRERRPSQRTAKLITSVVQREVAQEKADQRDAEEAERKQREAEDDGKRRKSQQMAARLARFHTNVRS